MIRLDDARQASVDRYLAGPVVDARLEMRSLLARRVLGRFTPTAGKIQWDITARRGALDVDVPSAQDVLTDAHPLAAQGQVLEAWWTWPVIGVSVPCGWWRIVEPERLSGTMWRVAATPDGPTRLDLARWWEPAERSVSGSLASQLGAILSAADVQWSPAEDFTERAAAATECKPGDTLLSTLESVLGQAASALRPDRYSRGVVVGADPGARQQVDHTWSDEQSPITSITGTPALNVIPNRVTVLCEREDGSGKRTVTGHSEALFAGPRRWDGPYGRVPDVVRLDEPVPAAELRAQAIRLLRRHQEEASSVEVVMRADPRVEVGDVARIVSSSDGTDCTARVTSVSLDAATGLGTVECAAISGTVAGVPANHLDNQ